MRGLLDQRQLAEFFSGECARPGETHGFAKDTFTGFCGLVGDETRTDDCIRQRLEHEFAVHGTRMVECIFYDADVDGLVARQPVDIDRNCHAVARVRRAAVCADCIRGTGVYDTTDVPCTRTVKDVVETNGVHRCSLDCSGQVGFRIVSSYAPSIQLNDAGVGRPAVSNIVH